MASAPGWNASVWWAPAPLHMVRLEWTPSRPALWRRFFTGGIGKISGVVVGVFIFTALTYSLTTLGIDTNLQFVFSGIIILVAVMLDCLKYVQKK